MILLGRRDFLASMSLGPGAYLLGSIFKANLLPAAMGAAATRKQFLLVTSGNGFIEQNYTCDHRSETDFDLAPAYQPLAPFKNDLVIASRFYNPVDKMQHGNSYAFLAVTASPIYPTDAGPEIPGGISIDRLIAKRVGAGDAYPSIALGCVFGSPGSYSTDGSRAFAPCFDGPARAFDKLFGAGTPDAIRRAKRASLLDFISTDIGKMSRRLAGPEKAKLDQYVTSIHGLEQQLKALASPLKCELPAEPGAALRTRGPLRSDEIDATFAVTFHAHLCGLTRVSHIDVPNSGNPQFDFLRTPAEKNLSMKDADGNDNLMNPHDMQHRGDYARIMRIDQWTSGRIALFLDRLSKTSDPGGSGTMLDNSLVAYMNYCGGTHHGGHETFSVLMAGRAGGAVKTGRYLTYGGGQYCVSDVFTSWANAMDVPLDKFGDPQFCKGPVPGLLG